MIRDKFTWNHADGFWYGPDLDPHEELDYPIDFTDLLDGDTIVSVSTTATNVTVAESSFSGPIVTLWLVSGMVGQTARVSIRLITQGGRTFERSFKIAIKDL